MRCLGARPGPSAREFPRPLSTRLVNLGSDLLGDDRLCRWLRRQLLRATGARIAGSAAMTGHTWFGGPANLTMGERCGIARGCHLDLTAPITLGDDVIVGHGTTITTAAWTIGPASRRARTGEGAPVVLESGVWIAADVTILPGVTIGAGSVVAARSLVVRDVPPKVLVAGSPARVVRSLEKLYADAGPAGPSPRQRRAAFTRFVDATYASGVRR